MDDFKEIENLPVRHKFRKKYILQSKALQKYFDLDHKKEKSNQEDIIIQLFLSLDGDDETKTNVIFYQLCNSLYSAGSDKIDDDIKSFIASSALNCISESMSKENIDVFLQVVSFMIISEEIFQELDINCIIFQCLNLIEFNPETAFDVLQKVALFSDDERVLKQLSDVCFNNFNVNNITIELFTRFLNSLLKKNTSNDTAIYLLEESNKFLNGKLLKGILKLIKQIAKNVDDIDVVMSSEVIKKIIDSFMCHNMDINYYNDFTSMLHTIGKRVRFPIELLSGLSDELMCIELLDGTMNEYIEKTVSLLVNQFSPENVIALVEGGIISSLIQLCDEGPFFAKLVAACGACQLVSAWPSETGLDAMEGDLIKYIDVLFQDDEEDIKLGASALTSLHAYADNNGLSNEFLSQLESTGLRELLEEKEIMLF